MNDDIKNLLEPLSEERLARIRTDVERLRGVYKIPITDGHGPAGGEEPDNAEFHVRRFETPPIQKRAADHIEVLLQALDNERAKVEKLEFPRTEVQAFACLMENALRRKDGQYGGNSWQKHTLAEEILPHLQERVEWVDSYLRNSKAYEKKGDALMADIERQSAVEQAINAANFAMMLVDILQPNRIRLPNPSNPIIPLVDQGDHL